MPVKGSREVAFMFWMANSAANFVVERRDAAAFVGIALLLAAIHIELAVLPSLYWRFTISIACLSIVTMVGYRNIVSDVQKFEIRRVLTRRG